MRPTVSLSLSLTPVAHSSHRHPPPESTVTLPFFSCQRATLIPLASHRAKPLLGARPLHHTRRLPSVAF
jgi:hypothetical protein